MAKANYYELPQDEIKEHLKQMYKAIAKLKTEKEVENFFKDLLSVSELAMLARRIQIALLLLRGFTYDAIIDLLKVGKTTITSVDRWLNYGFGGYRSLMKKIKSKKKINHNGDFGFSFTSLRNNYPAHFWLLNLLLDKKSKKENK